MQENFSQNHEIIGVRIAFPATKKLMSFLQYGSIIAGSMYWFAWFAQKMTVSFYDSLWKLSYFRYVLSSNNMDLLKKYVDNESALRENKFT